MSEPDARDASTVVRGLAVRAQIRPGDDTIAPEAGNDAAACSDCCGARPVFRIQLPAVSTRGHSAELLLCAYHCRTSRDALAAKGAAVYNIAGRLVSGGDALTGDAAQLWLTG